jgi:6-phospho-beta-glucosidase
VQHTYRGEDLIPLVERAWLAKRDDNDTSTFAKRLLQLTASLGSIPASYFLYYYFTEDILAELRAAGHTRAQEIMSNVGEYWSHYSEQARSTSPELDPQRSRGGIHELELAIDVLDAHFNDQGTVWPVNVRNGGVIPDLPDDCVVEIPAIVDRQGIHPVSYGALPRQAAGLVRMLASYQMLTAAAGWCGARNNAVRALMAHPWVTSPSLADALYTEMSAAQAQYLPGRLVA